MIKWLGAVLGVLFVYALYRTHQAATIAPRCPTVGELEQMNRDIYEGKTDLATAENLAKSYEAIAGCEDAASSIRATIAAKKLEDTSTSTATNKVPEGLQLTLPVAIDPWNKHSDAFTSDPNVAALDKIWRDRVLYYLEMDPRTLSPADLAGAKTLFDTLKKGSDPLSVGDLAAEALRRYIALADPSYGKAGDPAIFAAPPVTPIFSSVDAPTATAGLLLRDGEAA